jgi:hypothetical protein
MTGNEAYGVPRENQADEARQAHHGAVRNRIIVAVLALAVVGGTAGWFAAYRTMPHRTQSLAGAPSDLKVSTPAAVASVTFAPSEAPSATEPSSSRSPAAAPSATSARSDLLQLVDLGSGQWRPASHELLEGLWYWSNLCPAYGKDSDYPSLARRQSFDAVSWTDPQQGRTSEIVERFRDGAGAANLAEVRR